MMETRGDFVEVKAISTAWGRTQALANFSFVAGVIGAPIDAIHLIDARAGARREDVIRAHHSQMGRESLGGSTVPAHNAEREEVA